MLKETWFILGYVVSGVLAYGLLLGGSTQRWPYFNHFYKSVLAGLVGPFALFTALVTEYPYTFRFKPLTKQEGWLAHSEKWPCLSYKIFERTW